MMNRSLSVAIFFIVIGVSRVFADDISGNKTSSIPEEKDDDATNGQNNLASSNVTVSETEMEMDKIIMTAVDLLGQDGADEEVFEGRTVAVNRLQFMLLPLMYKMGVMTTLLVILVITSMKSMLIGVVLLVAKLASFLAKFHHHPHMEKHHHVEPHWAPPPPIYWPQPQPHPHPPPQPVHVHMHHEEHDDDIHDHYDHHDHHDHQEHHYEDHGHDHHHDGYDRRDHKIRNRISSSLSSPNNKWKDEEAYNPIAVMLENGQFVINKGYPTS